MTPTKMPICWPVDMLVQPQGFSFTSMSTGQQIGIFVGVIAALILVIKIL